MTPDTPEWCGSPSELANQIGTDLAANALTRHLNVNAARLKNDYGIELCGGCGMRAGELSSACCLPVKRLSHKHDACDGCNGI